jgi:hypothetical protein
MGNKMAYPKYIKDKEDGCVMILNEKKTEYENDIEGCSLGLKDYLGYKKYYEVSNKDQFEEYNKSLEDSWTREVRLSNKEWKEVIEILSKDEGSKELADKISEDLGYKC